MFNSGKNDMSTMKRGQFMIWRNHRSLSTPAMSFNNSQFRRSFPLPPELLLEILSYLGGCQSTLHSASLVCKQWLHCVAPILYSHPYIDDTYRWAIFILTLTRDRMSFCYGDLVRSIDLSSGKSIEAMKDHEFYRRLSYSIEEPVQPNRIIRITAENNTNHAMDRTHVRINHFHELFDTATHVDANTRAARLQQDQQDYLMKGLPFIIVSTSSLIQITHTCKNLTTLNLSYTSLLYDSLVAETGEYLSTLQRYSVQPGLTHIEISIDQAIRAIGKECTQLQEVKIQRCEWVTAHVIWKFVYFCPNLKRLDARRSTKCTVKPLISRVLMDPSCTLKESLYPLPTSASSSSSSSQDDPSSTTVPSSASSADVAYEISMGLNGIHPMIQVLEDEAVDHDEIDHLTLPTQFNEETGLFEIRDPTNQTNPHFRDGYWFGAALADEENQRPPSPIHFNARTRNTAGKSLKTMVHGILMDAKDLGAIDLNWLTDYP